MLFDDERRANRPLDLVTRRRSPCLTRRRPGSGRATVPAARPRTARPCLPTRTVRTSVRRPSGRCHRRPSARTCAGWPAGRSVDRTRSEGWRSMNQRARPLTLAADIREMSRALLRLLDLYVYRSGDRLNGNLLGRRLKLGRGSGPGRRALAFWPSPPRKKNQMIASTTTIARMIPRIVPMLEPSRSS